MIIVCLLLATIILFVLFLQKYVALPFSSLAISCLVLFFVIIISARVVKGFVPLPRGIRHLYHLMILPKDLYHPIVSDHFRFHEKGFSKTYSLTPKYLDVYVLGFSDRKDGISSKYKFTGKISVEFFWQNELLFKKDATSIKAASYIQKDMTKYKEIYLMTFDIPLQGKYKDEISVRISVEEPDQALKRHGDSIKLFIAVSPIP